MTTIRRPWQRRRVLLLGLGLALTVATAACGSSKSGATGGSTSSTSPSGGSTSGFASDQTTYSATLSSYPAIPTITGGVSSLKGKTVWYVPIGASVPILSNFGEGMQDGLAAAGLKYHICDGKFLPPNIASCLQQAETQGADAVVIGYVDYELVPAAIDSLVAHHIPVLVAGEAPDGGKTSNPQLAFFDTTRALEFAQKLMFEKIIEDSDGKANILYLGVVDSPNTKGSAAYGKSFLQQNCSGCTINEIDYNTASINKVPSQVSAALIAHPKTTYVVDELDAAGQPTLAGIQNAGYANKVKMAGTNADLDALQRIASNTVQFLDIGDGPTYQGWQYADSIMRMMKGQVPNEGIGIFRIFDKDNVGSVTLTPAAYQTNAWYGSDAFKATFTSAWGIS